MRDTSQWNGVYLMNMNMNNAAGMTYLLQRDLSSYKSSLSQWEYSVLKARTPTEAFRQASLQPNPKQMLRGMPGMYQSDKHRSKSTVERHLETVVSKLDPSDKNMESYMRATQGHFPNIYRLLENKKRLK
jgi:hypothetical protein